MQKSDKREIWVYIDLRNESFFRSGLNVLGKAGELAQEVSGSVSVIILGASSNNKSEINPDFPAQIPVDVAAEDCVAHGAETVYVLEHANLSVPRADVYAIALSDAVRTKNPLLLLFALTEFGRELAARTARLNNAGLIADCVDLKMKGEQLVAKCPSWSGEIMAEITFSDTQNTGFATVQPHDFKATEVRGKPGNVERVHLDQLETPEGLVLLSRAAELGEHRKLEDSEVVVVGGAGIGNAEGFGTLRELASVMGGEVGATRPPVLQHWVDEKRLIGQTGKTVRPKLLFTIGTSGAVQYTAGIMEADTIVAINRDKKAPIFQVADLGIVADWKTIVPLLTEKIKQTVMRKLADVLYEDTKIEAKEGFGTKIKKLRVAQDWSPEALAEATGQSPEFVLQVENDEITPPVGFLLRLARALEVDPGTFLHDEEKAMILDQRAKAFIKRTQNYSYETLTPGAENEHLRAFMITIESKKAHKPVAYKHEGEEFIFVMEGELEITLGNKTHHLKDGESIHFNSDTPHKLKSLSDRATRCLVVLFTP